MANLTKRTMASVGLYPVIGEFGLKTLVRGGEMRKTLRKNDDIPPILSKRVAAMTHLIRGWKVSIDAESAALDRSAPTNPAIGAIGMSYLRFPLQWMGCQKGISSLLGWFMGAENLGRGRSISSRGILRNIVRLPA